MTTAAIIVPIYNTAAWLPRCLDSLAAQTRRDFTAILVDDGSTDGSPALVAERVAADPAHFRAFRQENAGQAAARNRGIEAALAAGARYLLFVDSDDWVAPDFVEALLGAAEREGADIASCELSRAYDEGAGYRYEAATDRLWRELADGSLAEEPRWLLSRPGGIVDKAFAARLFAEIRFPAGITFEDLATTPRLMRRARRIVAVRKPLYFYYQRAASTVRSGDRRYLDALEAIRVLKADFREEFPRELAFIAVTRAGLGIAPRAARLPSWKADLGLLLAFLDAEFPDWPANPLLGRELGAKNRLILSLLRARAFGLLRLLVDGKRILLRLLGRAA